MKRILMKFIFYTLCSAIAIASNTALSKNLHSHRVKNGHDKQVVFLDQGWNDEIRGQFYQTTQGSRMLPYAWFLYLEQPNRRQKLRAPSNMRQMGFLIDGRSDTNPDRLPVGLAKDVDWVRGDSVGLTCAACHTGQLKYQGTSVRIDGGQSLIDLEAFQDGILAALDATVANHRKFERFADHVLGYLSNPTVREELFTEVEQYRDWWSHRISRSRGLSPHGPGRTDAFTIIGNEVVCVLLAIPDNCTPAIAPTQYPFLWDTTDFEWVQYNSSVHSTLGRNVGEVTGVFAEAKFAEDGSIISSANINNLFELEELLKLLRAPAWPEDILGAIDHNLAAKGDEIFFNECISCHTEDPQPRTALNVYGKSFAQVNFETPLSVLQTDPTAAYSFATRRAYPGVFLPIAKSLGIVGTDGKAPVAALLNISGKSIIERFFILEDFSPADKILYLGYRESRSPTIAQLTTYKARPLNGISFTAPFLHNGSVASIYELLLPPDQRLDKFYVGSKKFNPVKLGYSTRRRANTVLLDTGAIGNSNSGHNFGTDLSHYERMAVIEYIKTLK